MSSWPVKQVVRHCIDLRSLWRMVTPLSSRPTMRLLVMATRNTCGHSGARPHRLRPRRCSVRPRASAMQLSARRRAVLGERQDFGNGLFTSQITFVLQSFRAGQKFWIDRRRADGSTDRTHRFTDGAQECRAGVLHKMPAIGNLDGAGQCLLSCFAVSATTIAR